MTRKPRPLLKPTHAPMHADHDADYAERHNDERMILDHGAEPDALVDRDDDAAEEFAE
jgi:hypothetical protein